MRPSSAFHLIFLLTLPQQSLFDHYLLVSRAVYSLRKMSYDRGKEGTMIPLTANPRTVSEADFPMRGTPAEQLRFLLNYAVLAPSEYNAQPWLFRVLDKKVELYIDRSRRLPTVDPDDRETMISCSAACLNLRMALRHFGFEEEVEVVLDENILNLVACIWMMGKREATQEEHQLFYAIRHRRTNRQGFEDRSLPTSFLATCES